MSSAPYYLLRSCKLAKTFLEQPIAKCQNRRQKIKSADGRDTQRGSFHRSWAHTVPDVERKVSTEISKAVREVEAMVSGFWDRVLCENNQMRVLPC